MKKSFILYTEQEEIINNLTDEQAGKLLRAIFAFMKNDTIELDQLTTLAFIPIKQTLIRNNEKFLNIIERNKKNIKKRWKKQPQKHTKNTSGISGIPNTLDNDNDNDNDNDIYIRELRETLLIWNKTRNTTVKSYRSIEDNYRYWRAVYNASEIKKAIYNSVYDEKFLKNVSIETFFRQKNPNREKVDYIGRALIFKAPEIDPVFREVNGEIQRNMSKLSAERNKDVS